MEAADPWRHTRYPLILAAGGGQVLDGAFVFYHVGDGGVDQALGSGRGLATEGDGCRRDELGRSQRAEVQVAEQRVVRLNERGLQFGGFGEQRGDDVSRLRPCPHR